MRRFNPNSDYGVRDVFYKKPIQNKNTTYEVIITYGDTCKQGSFWNIKPTASLYGGFIAAETYDTIKYETFEEENFKNFILFMYNLSMLINRINGRYDDETRRYYKSIIKQMQREFDLYKIGEISNFKLQDLIPTQTHVQKTFKRLCKISAKINGNDTRVNPVMKDFIATV